jgi:hypothetical protein
VIKPQDKRSAEKMEISLPAAYMDRVKEHAKELDDSTPEYILSAIVQDYFDTGRDKETGGGAKPKMERSARPKEATNTVAMPKKRKEALTA